jgi:hypothetical protein
MTWSLALVHSLVARDMTDIAAAILPDGRTQVWFIKLTLTGSEIQTRWKETTDPGSAWSSWTTFPSPQGVNPVAISAAPLEDKRLELYLVDGNNQAWTAWKTGTSASSGWSAWAMFS